MQTQELSRVDAAIDYAVQELSKADPVIEQIRDEYMAIKVTGPDDDAGYQTAKVALDRVKRLRLDVEKTRKTLKADSLRYGKTVDGEAKRIKGLIEPIENHLSEQADIVRLEKARLKAEAERKRITQVQEWCGKLSRVGATIDLAALQEMDEDEFHFTLKSAEKKWNEQAAERQAEKERIEAERAELEQLRAEAQKRREAEESARKAVEAARLKPVRDRLAAVGVAVAGVPIPESLSEYAEQIGSILDEACRQIMDLA